MTAPAHQSSRTGSLLHQPKAVWAVAFACVISFMGIGLVDPILPAISESLKASPSQVSLLFTSYLVVTAIAMLGVNWLSSRIGAKWTLVAGLAVIVVFSALAGVSHTVNEIIMFRGGWGLGNAMFIATSLATIVASASGGFAGAIILYEAALGLGIATGPLIGGLLGNISWRGPFLGVAALMACALLATLAFIPELPKPEKKVSLSAPLAALKHRGLLTMGLVALFYNWGFFTMLGYAPYPMKLDALHLGLVFTGWGLLVALFAVLIAPKLQRRFGTAATLYANLVGLAVVMIVIALGVHHPRVVMAAVIVSGIGIGINNTLTTQAVMLVAPIDRSIVSSSYGFVRFIGGGLAPFVAGKLAEHFSDSTAFGVGAAAFALAIPMLASGHSLVTAAEAPQVEDAEEDADPEAQAAIAVAVGPHTSDEVFDRAVGEARDAGAPLVILHVAETDVVVDAAVDSESELDAERLVALRMEEARRAGIEARGEVLHSVGTHEDLGHQIAARAEALGVRTLVVGSRQETLSVTHTLSEDLKDRCLIVA